MTDTPNSPTSQQPPTEQVPPGQPQPQQAPPAQPYQAPPQGAPQGAPQPQYYAAQQQPYTGIGSAQKEKWVAVVLAFVLGWLGIHKFYLGYKNEGMIMLLVSVIGVVCTLGLGTIVISIIAIIEAAKYVILTEADFQATYVQRKKGWF